MSRRVKEGHERRRKSLPSAMLGRDQQRPLDASRISIQPTGASNSLAKLSDPVRFISLFYRASLFAADLQAGSFCEEGKWPPV